jgi:hypothetical protein
MILESEVHSKRRQLLALRNCATSQKTPLLNSKAKTAKILHKVSAEVVLIPATSWCYYRRDFPCSQPLAIQDECKNTRAKKPRWLSRYDYMGRMESSPLISSNLAARYKFYCFLLVLPPPYVQTFSWELSSRTPCLGNAYTVNMEAMKPFETCGTTRPVSC